MDMAVRRVIGLFGLGLALLASGCASTTVARTPCCYEGAVTLATLDALYLLDADGSRHRAAELLPGLGPHLGLAAPALPFREADIGRIPYGRLRVVLAEYDANGNGAMEEPELTVLYLSEAARGLGHSVEGVAVAERTEQRSQRRGPTRRAAAYPVIESRRTPRPRARGGRDRGDSVARPGREGDEADAGPASAGPDVSRLPHAPAGR
jgi:hypothetical protein